MTKGARTSLLGGLLFVAAAAAIAVLLAQTHRLGESPPTSDPLVVTDTDIADQAMTIPTSNAFEPERAAPSHTDTAATPVDDPSPPTAEAATSLPPAMDDPQGELWSRDMEQRVWQALGQSSTRFTTIEHVKCVHPTCEIQFTQGSPSSVGIMGEMMALMGNDSRGHPLIKQLGFTQREIFPGTKANILMLTTESEDFERSLEKVRRE